ncbi:tetratricopeptide repeat protein [Streptomyces virginiae]|uniref:tetratricopeptide repeat protein n=1 Tax=Streptomyces virginiae TaxID=1961 RepID=UPI002251CA4F|nr:tetratricopeptide repeat protein [Streptomyces virginiae]MCX5278328.1 NB-ARC domain-containing protein [Streptomyces virginiae]
MHVHADRGSLAVGRADHVTYHAAPHGAVSWPHQVGVIPRRASAFQDRASAWQLRDASADAATAARILDGMGGVGKTQLAADHARHAWENGEVDLLIWVTAASRQAVIEAYAQAAADILHADPAYPERAAAAFLAWLEPKPAPQPVRWLIVLDDVADPGDLRGLWPPAHSLGRTLITTRRRDATLTAHGRRVPVGLFTPAESLTYLQQALTVYGRSDNVADLAALTEALGHLPLALSQAAAYLADTHLDATHYRVRLADRARQLADLLPESEALPDDQPTTVAAAWSLSLERADQLRPAGLARPMLQLSAMLDANGVPLQVLIGEPVLTHLTAQRSDGAGQTLPAVSEEEAAGALRALHRLSLIDHTPDEPHQAVRAHQLIQRAIRDSLIPEDRDHVARTAADALIAAWPEVERDTDLARALRANATALLARAEDALYQPDAHGLLHRLGQSLGEAGQSSAAIKHFQHLTDTITHRLGRDHPHALAARGNLAHWRGEAGDSAGASAASAALLEDCLRLLGADHPETLGTRINLAACRGQAGDPDGAAAAFGALLEDLLRVLGPDHPHTLAARGNLAHWRGEAGDPAGAAQLTAALLEDRLRLLGADHPETLGTRINLAAWRGEAGDPDGAAAANAALLEDLLRVLGPDHPRTLATRGNLAHWRGEAGDLAGAAQLTAALLEDRLRLLGPHHLETLITRMNLVSWRGKAGDLAGADTAFAALLQPGDAASRGEGAVPGQGLTNGEGG